MNPNQNSPSPDVLTQEAELYYAQGNLIEAVSVCEKALELDPVWVPAHVTMGNLKQAQGDIEGAIKFYHQALQLNSTFVPAYANLGSMLYKQGRFQEAIFNYKKAIEFNPNIPAIYFNLAVVLEQQGQVEEANFYRQRAQELMTPTPEISSPVVTNEVSQWIEKGNELSLSGEFTEAISAWEKALSFNPNLAEVYFKISLIRHRKGQYKEMLEALYKAIEIQPDYALAYQNLCSFLRDTGNFSAARKAANNYGKNCQESDPIFSRLYGLSIAQASGLNEIAKDKFLEIQSLVRKDFKTIKTAAELKALYANLLYSMPYLRDDIDANSSLNRFIAQRYLDEVLTPNMRGEIFSNYPQNQVLKIGFLSNHFQRHSIGWCSLDIIEALSKLETEVYLYVTEPMKGDDLTQGFMKLAVKMFVPPVSIDGTINPLDIVQEIRQDQIDVLIDLDSLTVPSHGQIINYKPAPVCLSWLGFDAPYLSDQNYFLCDVHTHPQGREKYYKEQLIRMSNCWVAIKGFSRVMETRENLRKASRIGQDQVVYLSVASGRKFNQELARNQVAILRQVPDSVLVYKGIGDQEVFTNTYQKACQAEGVGFHRIKSLPRVPSEEEHRNAYLLADILLDSYPYNGGTHTLESLWFNLPVITYKGEQFLSRMGYSFLQGLGITEGVGSSWKEYVQWGVKLGKNQGLREEVIKKLEMAKNPDNLAPLWNPRKFAEELYNICQGLLEKMRKN